jgi:hypothetical protein
MKFLFFHLKLLIRLYKVVARDFEETKPVDLFISFFGKHFAAEKNLKLSEKLFAWQNRLDKKNYMA